MRRSRTSASNLSGSSLRRSSWIAYASAASVSRCAPRDADGAVPDAAAQVAGVILRPSVGRVRVFGIVAREDVQEERVVLGGAGQRSDVVEAPGEGEDAALAYPS